MTTTTLEIENYFDVHAQQQTFREVLGALSYPGSVRELGAPVNALWSILATFVDEDSYVADLDELVPWQMRVAIGYRATTVDLAEFVVCKVGGACPAMTPRLGDLYRPEQSATMIWVCEQLGQGSLKLRCSGPGVETTNCIAVDGMCPSWLAARADWCSRFPMGVDVLLCDLQRVVGLPRTSLVEIEQSGVAWGM